MFTTEPTVERLARQGWSYRTYRHALDDGSTGWAAEAAKGNARLLVYADMPERAAFLITHLVENRGTTDPGRRPAGNAATWSG